VQALKVESCKNIAKQSRIRSFKRLNISTATASPKQSVSPTPFRYYHCFSILQSFEPSTTRDKLFQINMFWLAKWNRVEAHEMGLLKMDCFESENNPF
jgi:hypothetical protein